MPRQGAIVKPSFLDEDFVKPWGEVLGSGYLLEGFEMAGIEQKRMVAPMELQEIGAALCSIRSVRFGDIGGGGGRVRPWGGRPPAPGPGAPPPAGGPGPPGGGGLTPATPWAPGPAAAAAMAGALTRVARLNHVPATRFGFRHGSIEGRVRALRAMVGERIGATAAERGSVRVKTATLAAGAFVAAAIVWDVLS